MLGHATTRRLAVMNLALRGIEADFGPEHADAFRRDLHPDLRADYVLANTARIAHFHSMKIADDEAARKRTKAKTKAFAVKGADVYAQV